MLEKVFIKLQVEITFVIEKESMYFVKKSLRRLFARNRQEQGAGSDITSNFMTCKFNLLEELLK
jgi:hypothetical protein